MFGKIGEWFDKKVTDIKHDKKANEAMTPAQKAASGFREMTEDLQKNKNVFKGHLEINAGHGMFAITSGSTTEDGLPIEGIVKYDDDGKFTGRIKINGQELPANEAERFAKDNIDLIKYRALASNAESAAQQDLRHMPEHQEK